MYAFFTHFIEILLDTIFPQTIALQKLRHMSVQQFYEHAQKYQTTTGGSAHVTTLFSYHDPLVRQLIAAIKYQQRDSAITLAADMLLDAMLEELSEFMQLHGNKKMILIPIPMHGKRRRERGNNHMEKIAKKMLRRGGDVCLELETTVLEKSKETKRQALIKNRRERIANVAHSFTLKDAERVRGRDVILLDDVITTGATLKDARRALRAAGPRSIRIYTLAH